MDLVSGDAAATRFQLERSKHQAYIFAQGLCTPRFFAGKVFRGEVRKVHEENLRNLKKKVETRLKGYDDKIAAATDEKMKADLVSGRERARNVLLEENVQHIVAKSLVNGLVGREAGRSGQDGGSG